MARPPSRRMMLSHLLPDLAPYVAPRRPPVRRMSLEHLMPEPEAMDAIEPVAAVEVTAPVPEAISTAPVRVPLDPFYAQSDWPIHVVVTYRDDPPRHLMRPRPTIPGMHRVIYREATEAEEERRAQGRAARPSQIEVRPEDDAYGPWGAPDPAPMPASLAEAKRSRR